MNPKPFLESNHLTVPLGISVLPQDPPLELLPDTTFLGATNRREIRNIQRLRPHRDAPIPAKSAWASRLDITTQDSNAIRLSTIWGMFRSTSINAASQIRPIIHL